HTAPGLRMLAAVASVAVGSLAAAADARLDFNRDVRLILSDRCFACHGPDAKRESGLRLDDGASATSELDSGARAVVPGKPDSSEMIARITSKDPDVVMPPPHFGKSVTPAEAALLRRWIEEGAEFKGHWSFTRAERPAEPEVATTAWCRGPIDRFVLARMEAAGLKPNPEADRATLARRVALDLTGLPPVPADVDAFLADTAPDAYEKYVDRLLASPHYGERMAIDWLDAARFADSNGFQADSSRQNWPWRDWVINALNADKPFDQFTIEQIAGDLLPNATRDQIVATGFHRNTMLNEEGGIDPLEFRFHAMTDRVATTGVTWLGLTVGCAQCHTHKFDPIQHREYYQMMAFLNNADEPDLDLPAPDSAAQRKAREEKAEKLLAELPEKWPAATAAERAVALETKLADWLTRERERSVTWTALRPVEAKSNSPLLTVQPDASVLGSGDITKSDTYELKFRDLPRGITAIRLEALPDPRLPKHGPGMAYYEGPQGDFFMGEFQAAADGAPVKFGKATESYAKNNFGKNPASAALTIDGDPQTGWSTADHEGEASEAVFQIASPLEDVRELSLKMMFGRHYACSLGRFRISVTTDSRAAEARDLPDEIERLLLLPDPALTAAQRNALREQFLLSAPEVAAAAKQIRTLRKPTAETTTLVFHERPPENPRPTFIHNRGEYLQPTDRVEPAVFSFLQPLPPNEKRDRLAFARWLVARKNSLTARVTVNRQWAILFGRGIVRTTEDFGYQGESPTHPELLDWLAVEFVKQGWSLKKLHRTIVTSATYRQSSRLTPELLAKDGENKLLARGPRSRLEAEMVRDATLSAAGLLNGKIGGPSVYPPQPEGVSEVAYGNFKWTASSGDDRYRRGIYTYAKRTAPYAMFATFDAPSGEACLARRDVSNSPLQALTLLNDLVLVDAAQAFGKQLAAGTGSVDERLRTLFRRCLTRPPNGEEVAALTKFFEAQKQRFESKELDAAKVAGDGTGDVNERAAWTAVARAVFNLDEAITRN
ncbi:MAG: PSD1 and planctomycete cytochrome C domain-containing protein, partial [Chthoniobacteraceae bacterium]